MNDEVVRLKDLSPGDEFRRFSGEHRYVVSSRREEHCGNVKIYCYNLTNGNAYDWTGSKKVVPLRRNKGGGTTVKEGCGEITRIPIHLEKDIKYQVEIQGNEVVISKEVKEPRWVDITKLCHLEFRYSQHCDGRYIAIIYRETNKQAVIIGMNGITAQKGLKIEKAPMAFTSFKIYKKA